MHNQKTTKRLIDLSHPLEPATPLWPGNPPTEFSILGTIPVGRGPTDRAVAGEDVVCNHSAFVTCNHTGTHMDAPAHFYNGVRTIEQVPLEQFIGAAALVDVRRVGPRGEINPADIAKCEEAIKATGKVIFWTGWSSRWGQDDYFDDYPVLSVSAAAWLLERKVHLVGMDTPSPDREPHSVHYVLLGANMVIVENLRGLEQIDRDVFELSVVPLPLKGLEASPVRAIAALPVAGPD
jgi:kynurenine formamidase